MQGVKYKQTPSQPASHKRQTQDFSTSEQSLAEFPRHSRAPAHLLDLHRLDSLTGDTGPSQRYLIYITVPHTLHTPAPYDDEMDA